MALELLLVHGDGAVRRRLRDAFRYAGARVATHASGKDGVTSYARARFDAVLSAPNLPDIDVWRFARMVRSGRFGFPDVPIIVTCEAHEHALFEPLIDGDTHLISLEGAAEQFVARVVRLIQERPKPSLLLVEDEAPAAEAAVRALEKYFDVDVASDGTASLDMWLSRRHDLVVLDLMLPGLSGAEVQSRILSIHPQQPIIILTAFDDPQRCESMMLKGSSDFVGKATDLTHFATHCSRVLQHARFVSAAETAIDSRQRLGAMSERVRAANLRLARGQTQAATQQLRHAIAISPDGELSDDTWARVLNDFPLDSGSDK